MDIRLGQRIHRHVGVMAPTESGLLTVCQGLAPPSVQTEDPLDSWVVDHMHGVRPLDQPEAVYHNYPLHDMAVHEVKEADRIYQEHKHVLSAGALDLLAIFHRYDDLPGRCYILLPYKVFHLRTELDHYVQALCCGAEMIFLTCSRTLYLNFLRNNTLASCELVVERANGASSLRQHVDQLCYLDEGSVILVYSQSCLEEANTDAVEG